MSDKVAELRSLLDQDDPSRWVANLWDNHNQQRRPWIEECLELRNYIFATDTSKTSNRNLPWKNSTTTPKLCQIRDNLHSNYISSLFPNDSWLVWKGYSLDDSIHKKAKAIESYMSNKCRESHFRTEVSKLLYDYIDYGNAFATIDFEANYKVNSLGESIPDYIGPRLRRVSPLDIVFNPLASSLKDTYKIVRSVKTLGEIKKLAATQPEQAFWKGVLDKREALRRHGGYSVEDYQKAVGYNVDGFGNLYEYYQSNFVEILEFFGDYHDTATGELTTNRIITVVDRKIAVRNVEMPNWFGHTPIYHVGWRFRPDNLWAMGPLANLVGMQYRIDHLENLKADAMDLAVWPAIAITGEVEGNEWGPGAQFFLDEGGNIQEISKNLNGIITTDQQIQTLEDKMELYAGAPRQAMGIRTPGEKTAFEVQSLDNAAGRIFQEKITTFEIELLEPSLNAMLETAVRNIDGHDIVRVMDDDLGVEIFTTITREDITAAGKIRPIGARHFAKQAQDLQNLTQLTNTPIWEAIKPHTSAIRLTKFIEDVTGLSAYNIFQPNIAISEQQETQSMINQASGDLAAKQAIDPRQAMQDYAAADAQAQQQGQPQ